MHPQSIRGSVWLLGRSCDYCGRPFTYRASVDRLYCSQRCYHARQGDPSTIAARFWSRVHKSADADGCWLWSGAIGVRGYGIFRVSNRTIQAHRFAWALEHGEVPAGLWVLHNCPGGDNRACVRPDHLWLGTQADNNRDMLAKGRYRSSFRGRRGSLHRSHLHPERNPRGEANGSAKLTAEQVRTLRRRYAAGGCTYVGLGREYGVDHKTIWFAVNGKTWTHIKN